MFELQKALDLCGVSNASFSFKKRLEAVRALWVICREQLRMAVKLTHTPSLINVNMPTH